MREDYDVELLLATEAGVIGRDEAERLREEALRLGRAPLELLQARGRISEDTLASLLREAREGASRPSLHAEGMKPSPPAMPPLAVDPADEIATSPPRATECPAAPPGQATPDERTFPIPGWERYRALRFLGQGGMGRVFLAYDTQLNREVALKFVRDDDPNLPHRFLDEARAQARVNHERVCKVYEVGEVQGRLYIAMQYVDGEPLGALSERLTVEQKAMLLRDAALGVHEAHRAGLIHRDLKPSNILVERAEDGALKPYVMDFGLAWDWNHERTATGAVLGTPHYMSPEQARGEVTRLDRRADVYSLGATLYQLLTGQRPIPGDNALEVLSRISTDEPRPPRAVEPDLPEDLEAITLKCLEKDRSARYDSARALAEDLDRFLSGEPVRARAGRWYRLRKRLHKYRALVGVGAAALVLVSGALGWAALTRRDAALREQFAQRFTEQVGHIEARARYAGLAPLHDIRKERASLREDLEALRAEIAQGGERAFGPGHYALGRGHLALGEVEKAREELEAAWQRGYRAPRVAYALALVMGRLYQAQLSEVRRTQPDRARRDTRRREVEQRYRAPVLSYLAQSAGADVPSVEYVSALIAFYEGRYDEALSRLEGVGEKLPWFYEAPLLRGDVLVERAYARWEQGDPAGRLSDLEAARKAYGEAIAIGESEPAPAQALGRLEAMWLGMELYGQGDVLPHVARAQEALSRALACAPDDGPSRVLQAQVFRRLAEYRLTHGGDVEEALTRALEIAQRAQADAPDFVPARVELGQVYWQRAHSRSERAQDPREDLRRAAELLEGVGPADRGYDFLLGLGQVFTTWANYEDRVGADASAHREKALQAYRAALAVDENGTMAWSTLGTEYLARASSPHAANAEEDLKQARSALDKALALNPKYIVALYYAGQVSELLASRKRERGEDSRPELAEALARYEQGLSVNPKFLALLNGVGVVRLAQAREDWDRGQDPFLALGEAQAAFEKMLAQDSKQAAALNNAGEAYARRAGFQRERGEDPTEATRKSAALFRRAAEVLGGSATPRANLALVYDNLALFELEHGREPRATLRLADEAAREALAKGPEDAKAREAQAEVLGLRARWQARQGPAGAGDFEAAERAYEKALALAPKDLDVRLGFGHFLVTWADALRAAHRDPAPTLERARSLAEEVLSARPTWASAHLLRATVRASLAEAAGPTERPSRWRQALDALDGALTRNPNLEPGWRDRRAHWQRLATGP